MLQKATNGMNMDSSLLPPSFLYLLSSRWASLLPTVPGRLPRSEKENPNQREPEGSGGNRDKQHCPSSVATTELTYCRRRRRRRRHSDVSGTWERVFIDAIRYVVRSQSGKVSILFKSTIYHYVSTVEKEGEDLAARERKDPFGSLEGPWLRGPALARLFD